MGKRVDELLKVVDDQFRPKSRWRRSKKGQYALKADGAGFGDTVKKQVSFGGDDFSYESPRKPDMWRTKQLESPKLTIPDELSPSKAAFSAFQEAVEGKTFRRQYRGRFENEAAGGNDSFAKAESSPEKECRDITLRRSTEVDIADVAIEPRSGPLKGKLISTKRRGSWIKVLRK